MSLRLLVAVLLCGALYLLGNARVQLWDRDEPRYAQASRQMLASGDWVVPQLLDEPRLKKPPMIYWLQAMAMRQVTRVAPLIGAPPREVMRRDAYAARLPSALAMILTLIVLTIILVRWVGEERAFWTVLIFGTSALVVVAAKMALTDAVLLLFVTIFQFCVYSVYKGKGSWLVVLAMGVSLGLAVLTKGPVVLGVAGATLAVLAVMRWLDRRQANQQTTAEDYELIVRQSVGFPTMPRERKPWGRWLLKSAVILAIATALVLPWVLALLKRMPPGPLLHTLRYEIFDRMAKPMEQHKGPPGYYLLFFFVSFFPWSLMLPTAIKLAWVHRRVPLVRFSFAAVVGPWLLFECVQTKLPHYVLPCFPFVAFLTADALFRCMRRRHEDWHTRAWLTAVAAWSIILILLGVGIWTPALSRFGFADLPYVAMTLITLTAIVIALAVFVRFRQHRIGAAAYTLAGGTLVVMALLVGWFLPKASFLHVSEEVGAYLQQIGATTKGDVLMLTYMEEDPSPAGGPLRARSIDYKEDSLPFYQGGTIRIQEQTAYLEKNPPEHWPTYMVLTKQIWDKTPEAAKAHLEILKSYKGWAYASRGRIVDVIVVKKK
jgi:4-amino-4-deoxy-L-arabinose transferase-like glycosyltransferase